MFESDGVTSKKDINNSDVKLKTRNLKDLVILIDFFLMMAFGVEEKFMIHKMANSIAAPCN